MLTSMSCFLREKGQGIVEYAVLISLVVAVGVYLFSNGGLLKAGISTTFSSTSSVLSSQ